MIRLISRAFWLSLFVVLSSSSTLEPVKRTQNESIPIMSNSSSSSSNQTVRATKVASIPIIAENNNKTATTQPKNEILVPKGTVPPTEAPEIVGDRKALMDIYSRCNGPSWVGPKGIRTNWNTPNVCVWYGIKCDNTTGRVVFIDIEQRTMACDLPPSISALSALRTFDVAGGLLGTIPQAMSTWTSIRHLKLYQNDFSGTLPEFISKFTELKEFAVVPRSASIGRLTGTLPAYLEKLPLQILVLDSNNMEGMIPSFVFNLTFFHLRGNAFKGPCPIPIPPRDKRSGYVNIQCTPAPTNHSQLLKRLQSMLNDTRRNYNGTNNNINNLQNSSANDSNISMYYKKDRRRQQGFRNPQRPSQRKDAKPNQQQGGGGGGFIWEQEEHSNQVNFNNNPYSEHGNGNNNNNNDFQQNFPPGRDGDQSPNNNNNNENPNHHRDTQSQYGDYQPRNDYNNNNFHQPHQYQQPQHETHAPPAGFPSLAEPFHPHPGTQVVGQEETEDFALYIVSVLLLIVFVMARRRSRSRLKA
eukprot:PhF_6_TR624/c1_g1_i3/m.829